MKTFFIPLNGELRLLKSGDFHLRKFDDSKLLITISQKTHYKYPYLLRNLEIVRRNQVWAMDITYIPMKKGLDDYFRFYNNERLHQSLDYQTPRQIYHFAA